LSFGAEYFVVLLPKDTEIQIYITVMLPGLYGREREERRLRVFEGRVLRKKFGPERDSVPGEWRRLHNG
jgi:hypothetical protein